MKLEKQSPWMNPNNATKIKEEWDAEMNTVISLDSRREVCREAHLMTISNSRREFSWETSGPNLAQPVQCWWKCGPQNGNHNWKCLVYEGCMWEKISPKIQRWSCSVQFLEDFREIPFFFSWWEVKWCQNCTAHMKCLNRIIHKQSVLWGWVRQS